MNDGCFTATAYSIPNFKVAILIRKLLSFLVKFRTKQIRSF